MGCANYLTKAASRGQRSVEGMDDPMSVEVAPNYHEAEGVVNGSVLSIVVFLHFMLPFCAAVNITGV